MTAFAMLVEMCSVDFELSQGGRYELSWNIMVVYCLPFAFKLKYTNRHCVQHPHSEWVPHDAHGVAMLINT